MQVAEEHPRRRTGGGVIRDHRRPSRPRLHLSKRKYDANEWTPPPEYKSRGLQLKVEEDPEEFPG
jgi:hypothetical protein